MIRKLQSLGAALACIGVSAVFSNAQAATWGAQVDISMITPCPSFCGGPGIRTSRSSDGGEFIDSAFTTLSDFGGSGQATASLNGPTLLPVLGAEGYSGTNSRTASRAVGMHGYI